MSQSIYSRNHSNNVCLMMSSIGFISREVTTTYYSGTQAHTLVHVSEADADISIYPALYSLPWLLMKNRFILCFVTVLFFSWIWHFLSIKKTPKKFAVNIGIEFYSLQNEGHTNPGLIWIFIDPFAMFKLYLAKHINT